MWNIIGYRSCRGRRWASWAKKMPAAHMYPRECQGPLPIVRRRSGWQQKVEVCKKIIIRRICNRQPILISIMASRSRTWSPPTESEIVRSSFRRWAKMTKVIRERKRWSNMLIWIRLISRISESANFINRLVPILKKDKVASRKGRWLLVRVSRFRRMMGCRRPRCFRSLKCHHPHRQKILISRPKTHKIFNWQMPSKDRISSLRSQTY